MKIIVSTLIFGVSFFSFQVGACAQDLGALKLLDGFKISEYAKVPGARHMALANDGTVFVGTRSEGKVFALTDKNQDYVVDKVVEVASGLTRPNGVAIKDGHLYVAETSRLLRFENILNNLDKPVSKVLTTSLPDEAHHGARVIEFGPDKNLYISIGAPCNVCEVSPKHGAIFRFGSNYELIPVALGVRDSLGLDWHPVTGEMWFTDNGRDMLGDNFPPDELNRLTKEKEHFGFPYCNGSRVPDPQFGSQMDCKKTTPPAQNLGPHIAALGMIFHSGKMFGEKYKNTVFIAEHGSWNRSKPLGYRVMTVTLSADGKKAEKYEPFVDGFLRNNGSRMGRPVDVLELRDGSLLVSDDYAGKVYRVVKESQ